MSKRLFDFFISIIALLLLSPILLIFLILVFIHDKSSPLYISPRVGKNGVIFKMIKLRSMLVDADKSGVDSTSSDDFRITKLGSKIRKYKLDELTQLWNVINGDMSLVGPRPNVKSGVDKYTVAEKKLLSVKPGITDFSSIVFSDEGEILKGRKDPDISYNQLIRPWKSRLGLIYIEKRSIFLDLKLIFYTLIAIFSRQLALKCVVSELKKMNVDNNVIEISKRNIDLYPYAPPELM